MSKNADKFWRVYYTEWRTLKQRAVSGVILVHSEAGGNDVMSVVKTARVTWRSRQLLDDVVVVAVKRARRRHLVFVIVCRGGVCGASQSHHRYRVMAEHRWRHGIDYVTTSMTSQHQWRHGVVGNDARYRESGALALTSGHVTIQHSARRARALARRPWRHAGVWWRHAGASMTSRRWGSVVAGVVMRELRLLVSKRRQSATRSRRPKTEVVGCGVDQLGRLPPVSEDLRLAQPPGGTKKTV